MAPRSQFIRLSDILENIDAVTEMIEGVELGSYRGDLKLRRAVERCVEIIGSEPTHPTSIEGGLSGSSVGRNSSHRQSAEASLRARR
jgi:hypothetical protein